MVGRLKKRHRLVMSSNGNKIRKQRMKGWCINMQLKDNTTSWVPLKELKDSHPVQLAEYAEAARLLDEPAFT